MYAAATSLDATMQQQEVIAKNLAHADVPGYRRQNMNFETFDLGLSSASPEIETGNILGTRPTSTYTVFEQGSYQHTGNPFDVAVQGDGFFAVQGPDGPLYTRNGTFQINGQGELVNSSGMPVLGSGGRITIPPQAASITISQDGTVFANGTTLGQLQLVRFANPNLLTQAGSTLFAAPPEAAPQQGEVTVQQGYREGSNVNVVNEMVAMIAGLRQYEAATKALRALSDAIQQNTSPQAG
jgi:flagellar basal-body rod protein FlgF